MHASLAGFALAAEYKRRYVQNSAAGTLDGVESEAAKNDYDEALVASL